MAEELLVNTNIVKSIIPYTQDEIELEVRQLLLSKGITDILYPGSNVSQLADIMTYLVHVLNTNTAINLQEVILPLATKRMNVLFGARQLGYEAVQKTSYRYELTIQIREDVDIDGNPTTGEFRVQLPQYTKFTSNGNDYWYLGEDIDITTNNQDRFDDDFTITVKEGDLKRYEDNDLLRFRAFNVIDKNGDIVTKQNYLVPLKGIEDDGLEVFLTYVDEFGTSVTKERWDKSEQFLIDSSYEYQKRKFIRLENFFLQFPSIFFEIGGYGNPIRLNTLVEINALISKGREGGAGDEFIVADTNLANQISASANEITHYGTNEENIESIKENAPIFHNSANRAVTALDYVALSQRHEAVSLASVWGGEDEISNRFANILFSFTPERTDRVFLSTDPTNDFNNSDSDYVLNVQYDLQHLPRRPEIPAVENPTDGTEPSKPINPDYIPKPTNYVEKPDQWTSTLVAEPVAVTNPGSGPEFTYIPERDFYDDGVSPVIPFPTDWVENPNIDSLWLSINPTAPEWATTEQQYLIKQPKQVEAYNDYVRLASELDENGDVLSTWTQALEDRDIQWFNDANNNILYKNYITNNDTMLYIPWRRDTTLYFVYTLEKAEWDRLASANKAYADYIESKEGIEYTNYWNSFSFYNTTPESLQTRIDADNEYNDYLEAVIVYEENRSDIDNLVDNWYLDDKKDVYRQSPPPLAPLRDTNVFTILDAYKILTMKHNHRKPSYCDFTFQIKILKYNLAQRSSTVNEQIFSIIDNYFKEYMEKFEVEYFASNLQRRVDEVLGDNSGVEINLTNQIALNETMFDKKYSGTDKIIIRLAFPFENLYPDGINLTNQQFLPNIDTLSFIGAVTDFRLTDGDSFNVVAGDSVMNKSTVNLTGIQGVKYVSKIAQIIDDTTDFTDKTKWTDLGGNYDHKYSDGDALIKTGETILVDDIGNTDPLREDGYVYTFLLADEAITVATEDFEDTLRWDKQKATAYSTSTESGTSINIKVGDTVYYDNDTTGTGGDGSVGSTYRSLKDFDTVDVSLEDFTRENNWEEIIPVSKDLYCLRTADGEGNITYRVSQNADPAVPGGFLPPTNEMPNILLPVYLGDIKDNQDDPNVGTPNGEQVGTYYIRNDRFQHIDLQISYGTGANKIPTISAFTDYGYGYLDLVYPSNVDVNSDNIPFTGYTIPRLKQVKFL